MVDEHKGITSIVQWVPFNEGWGEYDAGRIADLVKSWDPTRLVNHNSGSNCCDSDPDPGNGDVIDDHQYVGPGLHPASLRHPDRGQRRVRRPRPARAGARVVHRRQVRLRDGCPTPSALTNRYVQITGQLADLITTSGLSGSVYTEPTDVENELNGFFTYDRQIRKMDFARVREVNLRVLGAAQRHHPAAAQAGRSLRVTTARLHRPLPAAPGRRRRAPTWSAR